METPLEKLPVWDRMGTITLDEMDSIRLMNRVDTKYVTTEEKLLQILDDAASQGYRACIIKGERVTGYDSVYYDTPSLEMYINHHNGRKVRQKVRVRTYQVTGVTFLEIKRKNNKGRTRKVRIPVDGSYAMHFGDIEEAAAFLRENSWYTIDRISPELSTIFRRITLVNPAKTERLTIDTSLRFVNYRTGEEASLGNGVIIELKQDGHAASQMKGILLSHRVHPFSVSKYCIGTALTEPSVKKGRFKLKIRKIEKITGNKITSR